MMIHWKISFSLQFWKIHLEFRKRSLAWSRLIKMLSKGTSQWVYVWQLITDNSGRNRSDKLRSKADTTTLGMFKGMVTSGGECRNCHDKFFSVLKSDSYPTRHPLPEVTHASHFSDSSPPPSTLSVSAIVSSPGTTEPLPLRSLEEGSPVMPRLKI